jgi:hypothetical protein
MLKQPSLRGNPKGYMSLAVKNREAPAYNKGSSCILLRRGFASARLRPLTGLLLNVLDGDGDLEEKDAASSTEIMTTANCWYGEICGS